jgi:hypothetical protein
MDVFVNTLGVVGAFVLGVMALTLFFKVIGWIGGASNASLRVPRIRGVLDEKTRVTVHLANGTIFEDVLLVGSMSQVGSIKGDVPYGLQSLFVLEHPDGRRTLIQDKQIKMIEAPARP